MQAFKWSRILSILQSVRRHILFLLFVAPAWVGGSIGIAEGFGRIYPDSAVYILWAQFFAGANPHFLTYLSGQLFRSSLIIVAQRPFVPFLASILLRASVGTQFAFGLVNIVFWVLGVYACYYICRRIVSTRFGIICATFYGTSVPLLAYGGAVLSDCAGYFFMGLAFTLSLQKGSVMLRRRRAFGEGFLMALGSVSNPGGVLSLAYLTAVRCWVRKNIVPFVVGVGLLAVPAVLLVAGMGSLTKLSEFVFQVLGRRLIVIRSGLPYFDAFLWAFNLSGVYLFPLFYPYTVWFVFLGSVVAGMVYVPRKKALLQYIPFLLAYEFVAQAAIERYLFYVWPVFIPVLLFGLGKLTSTVTMVIHRFTGGRIRLDPLLFVALYIDLQAWVNLTRLYPSVAPLLKL